MPVERATRVLQLRSRRLTTLFGWPAPRAARLWCAQAFGPARSISKVQPPLL